MPQQTVRIVRIPVSNDLDMADSDLERAHATLDELTAQGYRWRETRYIGARPVNGEAVEHALVTMVYEETAREGALLRFARWLSRVF